MKNSINMNKLNQKDISYYQDEGFIIIKNFLSKDIFIDLLKAINYVLYLQIIKAYPDEDYLKKSRDPNDYTKLDDLDWACKYLFEHDPIAFRASQKLLSQSTHSVFGRLHGKILKLLSPLIGYFNENLFHEGGTFVPNIPGNTCKLYSWHSEASWLPYRRNFVNVWIPLFRDKEPLHGTMYLMPKSHKHSNWNFTEFRGYDKKSFGEVDHYTQYDIPDSELKNYSPMAIRAKVGDVVLFDRNTVHRSEINESDKTGYIYVNRFFDLRKDLTLSPNLNERPYSNTSVEYGRPGLTPID